MKPIISSTNTNWQSFLLSQNELNHSRVIVLILREDNLCMNRSLMITRMAEGLKSVMLCDILELYFQSMERVPLISL